MVEPEAEQEALDAINRHCPSDIRVISMVRVTKNFNAKNHCHRRTYEYFLPTFLMAPDPLSMVDPFQRGQHFRTAHASAQVAAARLRRARAAGKLPPAPEEATIRVFTRKAAPPAPAPAPQPAAVPAASPAVPTPAPVPASGAGAAAPSEAAASSAAPTTSPSPPASTPAATPAATEDNDAGPPPRHDLTDRVAVASDTTRLPVGIDVDVASVQQQHDWPDLYNHRISPSALAKLRAVAKRFTGTHNFHNYTRGKAPGDPRCVGARHTPYSVHVSPVARVIAPRQLRPLHRGLQGARARGDRECVPRASNTPALPPYTHTHTHPTHTHPHSLCRPPCARQTWSSCA